MIETLDRVHVDDGGKAEAWVPLQLLDPDVRVVTEVRFQVALKKL